MGHELKAAGRPAPRRARGRPAGEGQRRGAGGDTAGVDDPHRAGVAGHGRRQRARRVEQRRVGLLRRWRGGDEQPVSGRGAAALELVGGDSVGAGGQCQRHQPRLDTDAQPGAETPAVGVGLESTAGGRWSATPAPARWRASSRRARRRRSRRRSRSRGASARATRSASSCAASERRGRWRVGTRTEIHSCPLASDSTAQTMPDPIEAARARRAGSAPAVWPGRDSSSTGAHVDVGQRSFARVEGGADHHLAGGERDLGGEHRLFSRVPAGIRPTGT